MGGQELKDNYISIPNEIFLVLKKFYTGSDSDFKACASVQLRKTQWFYLGNTENCYLGNQRPMEMRLLYVWLEKDSGDPIELSNCISFNIPSRQWWT